MTKKATSNETVTPVKKRVIKKVKPVEETPHIVVVPPQPKLSIIDKIKSFFTFND